MPTVRPMSSTYACVVTIVLKLVRLQTRTTLPVNWLVCQNAVISRTTSAARYSSTNQASPGVSSRVARAHGRRHSAADRRGQNPSCPAGRAGPAARVSAMRHRSRAASPGWSLDLGIPRGHPVGVRHAVLLAVVARRDRGLPERDGLEVAGRRVRVVLLAR